MLRVVKIGGSLFDWHELPDQLWRWLQEQPPASNLLVAGGGELCDVIRRWDASYGLGEEKSHALCLNLMGASAVLLEQMIARERCASSIPDRQRDISVLDVPAFLNENASRARVALPHTWQVTSDSLAAQVAEIVGAEELVLLKSTSLPRSMSLHAAAGRQFVDAFFPIAAARVAKIRAVHLRDESFPEWMLFP